MEARRSKKARLPQKIHLDKHMTDISGRLVPHYYLNGKTSSLQHQYGTNGEALSTPYAPPMALEELSSKVR